MVIISDKDIMHSTQETMVQKYGNHITKNGVTFGSEMRKVLTTRNDGHLWINISDTGNRTYQKLSIN